MTDPRIKKLADVLVNYSVGVKPGDWVVVYYHPLAESFAGEVFRAVLEVGGHPSSMVDSEILQETSYRYSSEEQLAWVSPIEKLVYNEVDVAIVLLASNNTRYLSNVDPKKQQKRAEAMGELTQTMMKRSAAGDMRWTMTQFPCPAYAQEADMCLDDFQNFVHKATFTDQEDPVAEWKKVRAEQEKIVEWLKGKKTVTVKSPTADLKLSIAGRDFINADGTFNMPSGEVYTSPIEDSAQGWVEFTYPAITRGREVSGVRFEIKDGKVIKATAEKNEEFLLTILDTDQGSRYLGEFAIGTNYGIKKFTGSILYDEKIGGSFHVAVGGGFPEIGGKNESAIHWDFICDIQKDSEIRVDGELLYKDGQFVI